MNDDKKKRITAIILAVVLNVSLIICVILSVHSAFNDAESVSFSQNIENVRTLTNASASKVELVFRHHTQVISGVAEYVNGYNDVGMTEEELYSFFDECFTPQKSVYTWQLADSELNDNSNSSNRGFNTVALCDMADGKFSYKAQAYPELAKIFGVASEKTIGEYNYTSEFTDASPALVKAAAVTTTVRVRGDDGYSYKTLMLLLESDYIDRLIANNNNVDTMSFFDYSNVIVDDDGNYVISNSYFQGTNFADYVSLYNESFTDADAATLREKLRQNDYSDVLYYKNNRGQDCAYTIVPVQNSDWHILSIVPLASFHNAYDFNHNFVVFGLFFGLLFLVDIIFVLVINRQLRRKTKEAQAANLAKSEFLSSMSHDIRTPMNAIIGMTVIAGENLSEQQPDIETLKDCVKTIEVSGNHLLTLINDVLDISKIENGKVALSNDDFSISETMSKLLEIVQPQIKEKDFRFETHILNVNHEFVHADELRINQVYINILSNAIKYTEPGGRITADLIEEPVPGNSGVARFVYRVSDTGIGMDKEFLKTIFDRFSRAVDTRVNTTQGTGLGMAISKQLVDLMGGTITVESELNVGSTFTVTLDLPVADVSVERVSLENVSALLIDDDPILLETAEISMEKAGMSVDTSLRGRDGIDMAVSGHGQGQPYDVILVDWKMSAMNGIEVVGELRRRLGAESKIIVMTAYNIADIEKEGRAAGADGFITKPLFQSKLLHTIQSVLADSGMPEHSGDSQHFDLRVLVAEDNNTNWKVLDKLLSSHGVQADHAENGRRAVEAVESSVEPYDLVLMDIQMPVMNGYDATEAIRRLGDAQRAAVPIYAMTADTFAEDVAKCLEKGMNGHLAKPIDTKLLYQTLRKYTR